MFDQGFTVISKAADGWRVTTREGCWNMSEYEPKPQRPPVKKAAPVTKPVQKAEPDLVGLVEELVSSALDAALTESDPVGDLRDDVAGLTNALDEADEKTDFLQRSEDDLRDQTVALLDNAVALMKFSGVQPSGNPPLNMDDALAASLARRRGR